MKTFNGQLTTNEAISALSNMIIGQYVTTKNIANHFSTLRDKYAAEGSQYGDTILVTETQEMHSEEWTGDAEMQNVLNSFRPLAPNVQSITIDTFRKISLTVDSYLTKRAWMNEMVFSTFTGVLTAWMNDTKKLHESTTINAFIGTYETTVGRQTQTITLEKQAGNLEASNRLEAQQLGRTMAKLITDLGDSTRDFNDLEFLRSYDESDLVVIFNSDWLEKITSVDLPTIFHDETVIKHLNDYRLPARFFGTVNKSPSTTASDNKNVRALVEKEYGGKWYFPGDLLPNSTAYLANETYTQSADIPFKILHAESLKFMSSFSAETEFWNPASLTTNKYVIWGYSHLEPLVGKPWVTVKVAGK